MAEKGKLTIQMPDIDWSKYLSEKPFTFSREILENPDLYIYPETSSSNSVPVIFFRSNVITQRKDLELPTKNGFVDLTDQEGLMYATLIHRNGEWVTK
ncbi:hypothetical protein [Peribacillus butanolivorans]|uniref:hypothetical protein n=1 Tax=Peribacillus butanolivorans TaxID=421767 RepID=UPI0030EFA399